MTHHYTIEIISKQLFFKATYRNKKFRKLEHLRGKLNQELMDAIGKTIPVNEDNFADFNKKWYQKVNYQIEVKKQSLHAQFKDKFTMFFENHNNGITPKYTGAEINALKQIENYLKSQSINEQEAFNTWEMILDKWEELSPFHQSQMDLKYINSKLNVIIREIIKSTGTDTSGANSSVSI